MKITVTLNGNTTILEADPDTSLMTVLRKNGLNSVKCGCGEGLCGSCTVLFNDKPAATCKIPAGITSNAQIITLEYFKQTEEYQSIKQGFDLANISLCGYCDAGKIFSTYQILKMQKAPSHQQLVEQFKLLAPCCTDLNSLINGVILAWDIQHKGYEQVIKSFRKRK